MRPRIPAMDPDSDANSVSSTPSLGHRNHAAHHVDGGVVRLMCSFGGRILPRPNDDELRYVGGETRIAAVGRSSTFADLHSKFSKLAGAADLAVKYQLPSEDLDALISVNSDEDVENMMEEYDRLSGAAVSAGGRTPRLRIFLFPSGGGFGSTIDGSGSNSKHDRWFIDVLNGGAGLERGRSEASSVLSEVPDYLFGLDNSSDEPKLKPRGNLDEAFDPGSPIPATSPPNYCSTSSTPSVQPIKTEQEETRNAPVEPPQVHQTGYSGNPVWRFPHEQARVYYMPGNVPVRAVPMSVQYFNQVSQVADGPVPIQGVWTNSSRAGPVYVSGPSVGRPGVTGAYDYRVVGMESYGAPSTVVYPSTGVPQMGREPPGITGSETKLGRGSQ